MPLTQQEQDELELLQLEEEEAQASKPASTGMGNLKVAEQRIGEPAVERPNMASPENLARAAAVSGGGGSMTSMGIPAKAQTEAAAQYGRIVPAVIAAPMTGGMSLPAAAATLATVGGLSEAGAQGLELASDNREQMEPGKIAGAAVRSGVPISRFANPILRVGANVGGQIAGNLAGKTLEKGGELPTPEEAVVEAAVPTAMASAGRVVQAAVRGGGRVSGAVADLFRPYELTPDQLRGIRARETIRLATGQEVPIGLAEAINSGTLTRRMGLVGTEPTPEQMSQLSQLVLHSAANGKANTQTANEISGQVFDILDPQRQGISDEVKKAVEAFSKTAARSVKRAEADIQAAGRGFFPPGRVAADIGEAGGNEAAAVMKSSTDDWNAAYKVAREIPEYNELRPGIDRLLEKGKDLGVSFMRDSTGRISTMAAPPGARSALSGTARLEGAADPSAVWYDEYGALGEVPGGPTTTTVEQLRQYISELGRNLRNSSFMPDVSTHVRNELLQEAKGILDESVATVPALQQALGAANKKYSENIGRFKSAFAEGIINDFGEDGGLTGEAIIRKFSGSDAATNIRQYLKLLGRGATAGQDRSARGVELVREGIMAGASRVGRDKGQVSIGPMFGKIDDVYSQLTPAEAAEIFPNYNAMKQAMLQEVAVGQAGKSVSSPKAYLDALEADPRLIEQAFGAADAKTAATLAKQAIAKSEAEAGELSRLGLDELANREGFKIDQFISNLANTKKFANLAAKLQAKDPTLLQNVRASFVDRLMDKSTELGEFSPGKFMDYLKGPSGSNRGGDYHEAARELFGRDGLAQVQSVMSAMENIPTPRMTNAELERSLGQYLMGSQNASIAGKTIAAPIAALGRILRTAPELRYRFAANYLTTPELRKAAMTPLDASSQQSLRTVANLVSHQLLEKYGPDDERSKLARQAQEVLNKR